jgi:multiple sugar transport system substrate-binding protein
MMCFSNHWTFTMTSKSLFIPLLLLPFLFLSCAKKSNVVEIQDWNFGGRPHLMVWLRERATAFEKLHPGIKIVQSDKSWNMIREILYASFTTGTGPDVVNTHANYAAEFGEAGHYYPLNKFPDFEQVRKWFIPELMEATKYKGNYYGLPSSGIAFALICNKSMFDAEGIKPPKTWSQFREAARRLTKDTDGDGNIDQYGLVLMGGDKGGFAYRLIPFMYKAGIDFMSDDLKKVTFNSPMGIATLKLFADMYQIDHSVPPGFLAYGHTESNDMFCGKKVAMCVEGSWVWGMVREKDPSMELYIVPVPVPDGMIDRYDTLPTLQDMVMYSVNARSANPDSAWEFVKFLRNEEADMAWIREDLGATAVTIAALESPEAKNVRDLPLFIHELKNARPFPSHPSIVAAASNIFTPYCQKAIVGELSPQDALNRAAAEAQAVIEGRE